VFVLSAEEAGWYKPNARVYREACRRLGSPPARTLLVAGSVYDAEGGLRAGLRSTLVTRRADQRAPDPRVRVVESLEQVAAELTGVPRLPGC
jgi:FMN phosphatase YigB (HAD superfamily)